MMEAQKRPDDEDLLCPDAIRAKLVQAFKSKPPPGATCQMFEGKSRCSNSVFVKCGHCDLDFCDLHFCDHRLKFQTECENLLKSVEKDAKECDQVSATLQPWKAQIKSLIEFIDIEKERLEELLRVTEQRLEQAAAGSSRRAEADDLRASLRSSQLQQAKAIADQLKVAATAPKLDSQDFGWPPTDEQTKEIEACKAKLDIVIGTATGICGGCIAFSSIEFIDVEKERLEELLRTTEQRLEQAAAGSSRRAEADGLKASIRSGELKKAKAIADRLKAAPAAAPKLESQDFGSPPTDEQKKEIEACKAKLVSIIGTATRICGGREDEDLKCPLCKDIFTDPCFVCPNHHTLCRKCHKRHLETHLFGHARCPVCRQMLCTPTEHAAMARLVKEFHSKPPPDATCQVREGETQCPNSVSKNCGHCDQYFCEFHYCKHRLEFQTECENLLESVEKDAKECDKVSATLQPWKAQIASFIEFIDSLEELLRTTEQRLEQAAAGSSRRAEADGLRTALQSDQLKEAKAIGDRLKSAFSKAPKLDSQKLGLPPTEEQKNEIEACKAKLSTIIETTHVSSVDIKDLRCPVCKTIFTDPCFVCPNHHTVCRECHRGILETTPYAAKCPECREKLITPKQDAAMAKLIKVFCSKALLGATCEGEGEGETQCSYSVLVNCGHCDKNLCDVHFSDHRLKFQTECLNLLSTVEKDAKECEQVSAKLQPWKAQIKNLIEFIGKKKEHLEKLLRATEQRLEQAAAGSSRGAETEGLKKSLQSFQLKEAKAISDRLKAATAEAPKLESKAFGSPPTSEQKKEIEACKSKLDTVIDTATKTCGGIPE
uniref:RING-type domain-containing protein n=1 Tax=Macrostomum lignano TaxID=282301 RepID=A0A1I8GMS1_9PLAT